MQKAPIFPSISTHATLVSSKDLHRIERNNEKKLFLPFLWKRNFYGKNPKLFPTKKQDCTKHSKVIVMSWQEALFRVLQQVNSANYQS